MKDDSENQVCIIVLVCIWPVNNILVPNKIFTAVNWSRWSDIEVVMLPEVYLWICVFAKMSPVSVVGLSVVTIRGVNWEVYLL